MVTTRKEKVCATETESGRRWAEARIKALTGGDKIAARFMRQDFFEFTPTFKLVVAGNHKPELSAVDEAIRRRLHLIPFDVTVPAEERDPDLAEKLKAEWPGILKWIIDGCISWQTIGLSPPEIVTSATAEYLEQQDSIAAWLAECCTIDVQAREGSKRLAENWKRWAAAAGIEPGKRTDFLDALTRKGFHGRKTNAGMTYFGLQIMADMTGAAWAE
jgi:putative DNA primase/helicase